MSARRATRGIVRAAAAVVFALAAASCGGLGNPTAPALAGPSELALSLQVTASPDTVQQNGHDYSVIDVFARDQNAAPVSNVTFSVQTSVGGVFTDYGTLSQRTGTTNTSGHATILYTPPALPALAQDQGTVVLIVVTPYGSNYANETPREAAVRLVPPGVVLPPNSPPVPNFFVTPSSAHVGDDLLFDGSASSDSDGTIQNYVWQFGDGGSASGVRVHHTYSLPGTYAVTLTVTDDRGASVTSAPQSVTVAAQAGPSAAFTFSPAAPSIGDAVHFNASASTASVGHTIVSYAWDFGDGSSGSGITPAHAYAAAASYTVVLVVTDDLGQTGTTSQAVVITAAGAPTAAFTLSPTAPNVGDVVHFNASTSKAVSGHSIVAYAWDFGDGATGTGVAPVHTYTAAGSVTIVLTVTDDAGHTGTTVQAVQIKGTSAPTAAFTFSPSAPSVGVAIYFNASASTAASGHTLTSYAWDFGDGTTATGLTATHAYAAVGTYTVTLVATDDASQTGTTSQAVAVSSATAPTAAFTISPTNPIVGDNVTFNASNSKVATGHTIVSYAWDFGDGNTATSATPSVTHQFDAVRSYTVVLVVTDSAGLTGTTSTALSVGAAPAATFTISPTDPVVGDNITFNASASTASTGHTIATYAWDFGDGNTASTASPTVTHQFDAVRTYTVVLTVTDTGNHVATFSMTVGVAAAPVAAFVFSPTDPLAGQIVNFDATTSTASTGHHIVSYTWDFGDGTFATTGTTTQHTYAAAHTYTVVLTVTDDGGHSATVTVTVTVGGQ